MGMGRGRGGGFRWRGRGRGLGRGVVGWRGRRVLLRGFCRLEGWREGRGGRQVHGRVFWVYVTLDGDEAGCWRIRV